jgi:hypothetical protein
MKNILIVLALVGAPSLALSQSPPVAVSQPADVQVASPATSSGSVAVIQSIVDKIPESMPGYLLAMFVFLIEMMMRLWPTIKPRSLLILVGNLVGLLGTGFIRISKLLDMLVQNLRDT